MPPRRLHKLDSLRGFAALYVVAHHFAHLYLLHRWYALPLAFGPEAVMLFFVLSGFVICCSTTTDPSDLNVRDFLVKRIRRIYPIFVVGLTLGYISHAFIARAWFTPDWQTLAGNLGMLQDFQEVKPGVRIGTFYDLPLWSLSYEFWFYVLYVVVVKSERRPGFRQFWVAGISLFGAVSYVAVHSQPSLFLMFFIVWWSGVELAREFLEGSKLTWRRQAVPITTLAIIAVVCTFPIIEMVHENAHIPFFNYPVLFVRVLTAAVVFVCGGVLWHKLRFIGFDRITGPFALAAPISYAIYVVHFPIITALESVYPGRFILLKIGLACLATLFLARELELGVQPLINSWANRFLRAPSRLPDTILDDSFKNLALEP